jgi:hypothetical protein
MTWRLLPPVSQMREWLTRRRAATLLEELGLAGSDPRPVPVPPRSDPPRWNFIVLMGALALLWLTRSDVRVLAAQDVFLRQGFLLLSRHRGSGERNGAGPGARAAQDGDTLLLVGLTAPPFRRTNSEACLAALTVSARNHLPPSRVIPAPKAASQSRSATCQVP